MFMCSLTKEEAVVEQEPFFKKIGVHEWLCIDQTEKQRLAEVIHINVWATFIGIAFLTLFIGLRFFGLRFRVSTIELNRKLFSVALPSMYWHRVIAASYLCDSSLVY